MVIKINKALDFAIIFIVFSSSLAFLSYSLQNGKYHYLLLALIIYFLSFIFRKHLMHQTYEKGLTEPGMIFISLSFVSYTLFLTGNNAEVAGYLPENMMLNSGAAYISLFVYSLIVKDDSNKSVYVFIIFYVVILSIENQINSVFLSYPWISKLIVGTPYIYLFKLLTGISVESLTIRKN